LPTSRCQLTEALGSGALAALFVLHFPYEGNSIRRIERITGTGKRTILRLLVEVGGGCARLLTELVKGVAVEDVQADEVWGYVRCKEGTKTRKKIEDPEAGDASCTWQVPGPAARTRRPQSSEILRFSGGSS